MNRRLSAAAWAVLTEEEEQMLLDTTRTAGDAEAFRDWAILSVALGSGLRVQEIAALRVGDVLTPTGRIKQVVELPFAKGGSKAPAHFGRTLRRRLAAWIEELGSHGSLDRTSPLWPASRSRAARPISVRTIQAAFTRRSQAAGLRRVRFHDLRHTYVTRLAETTKGDAYVVQALARHADPRTTSYYVHAPQARLLEAADGVLG